MEEIIIAAAALMKKHTHRIQQKPHNSNKTMKRNPKKKE